MIPGNAVLFFLGSFAFAGTAEAHEALDHAGPVRVGSSFSALESRAIWKAGGYGDAGSKLACEYYSGKLLPEGVAMMVEDGKVVRFDLLDEAHRGPFGIQAGDSEAVALSKLPKGSQISQHHYGDEGDHYLTWRDPDTDLAIRVETWQGQVTGMYWGKWNAVQYVEGCL